jgi:DNA mismatch repair protein MutS
MTNDVTPIRQQYLEIKRKYPNAILFFRLGDFYETFDQDAETAARERVARPSSWNSLPRR